MLSNEKGYAQIKILKQRIEQPDYGFKLEALAEIAEYYTYTNIREARKTLEDLGSLLTKHHNPEISLSYHLNLAIVENQFYNYKLSDINFKEAVKWVEKIGNATRQAEVYIDYAGTLINIEDIQGAFDYLEKARKLLAAFPNDRLKAYLYCREGYALWLSGEYERATQSFFKAETLFNAYEPKTLTIKDMYFQTLVHSGFAIAHEKSGDMTSAVNSYLRVVSICEKAGIRSRLAWHYLNVGKTYMYIGDYEKAEPIFKKINLLTDDISQSARAYATANLGYCSYLGGKYEEALELYTRAEQIYKRKNDDFENLARLSHWTGLLLDAIGKRKRADKRFAEALTYASKISNPRLQALICDDIAEIYAERGDYKNAYEYEVLHNTFIKKYYEETNQINIKELEFKYKAESRRKEMEFLKLQSSGLQLKALRAQMNPHFMYNALNSIQKYIGMNEAAEAERFLAKFSKLMRTSLEYSEMEIISLESELEFLRDYLDLNQKLRFDEQMQYKIIVDEDLEEDIMGVPTMIIQPYIENAIEHGLRPKKGGMLVIDFKLLDEDTILCVVEDNGIGRSQARKQQELDGYDLRHKSRGTSITEKRLQILHSNRKDTFSVNTIDLVDPLSKKPIGTRVEIKIPIIEMPIKTNAAP